MFENIKVSIKEILSGFVKQDVAAKGLKGIQVRNFGPY